MSTNEIEEFMNGALISWIKSCIPRNKVIVGYESLLDGTILHSVYLQIDPNPQYHPVELKNAGSSALSSVRLWNFDVIVRNLRNLYDEELGQTILDLPDSTILGHAPESLGGLEQMKLLITLLLRAAVQCPNKKIFIARIKKMDVNTQQAIVEVTMQVTGSQTLVLTQKAVDQLPTDVMCKHIVRLAKERDQYHCKWMSSVILENEIMNSVHNSSSSATSSANTPSTSSENNHLADYESELQKLRNKLEEKSELLIELKEGLREKCTQYEKLLSESQISMNASAYRDEVEFEFYRKKVEELQEDNRMLLKTKKILEEKLHPSLKRTDQVAALEAEIFRLRLTVDDMSMERVANQIKLQELLEKNVQLELVNKDLMATPDNVMNLNNSDADEDISSNDKSLSEQLASNAQSRVINLELENRRILEELESSSNKILELEKDKKKLSLQNEQLQENYSLLTQEKRVLECDFKNVLEENRNLDRSFENKTKEVQQLNEVLEEYDSMKKKSYEVEESIEWEKKVQELEKKNRELLSQAKIQDETITILKEHLYNGILAKKQVEQSLMRLGLNEIDKENNDMNLKLFVEKLCQTPESLRTIQEIVQFHRQEVSPAENVVKLETANPSEAELDQLQTENTSLQSQTLQSNAQAQEKFYKEGSSFTESSPRQAVLGTIINVLLLIAILTILFSIIYFILKSTFA